MFSIYGGDPTMLGKCILDELGISIDANGYLITQDERKQFLQGGCPIKYSYISPEKMYLSDGELLFDPIHNLKMMTFMIGYYLDNEEQIEKTGIVVYDKAVGDQKDHLGIKGVKFRFKKNNKMSINDLMSDRAKLDKDDGMIYMESNPYRNKCLCVCDLILQFANMENNLSEFDVEEEE